MITKTFKVGDQVRINWEKSNYEYSENYKYTGTVFNIYNEDYYEVKGFLRDDPEYSLSFTSKYLELIKPSNSKTTKSKSSKPTIEVIQDKVIKFSDSATKYYKDEIELAFSVVKNPQAITRCKLTPMQALGLAKKIRREVARHKKLKF